MKGWAEVMQFASDLRWSPATQILEDIERVMAEEGIAYTRQTSDSKRGFRDEQWEKVFELDGGLKLRVEFIKRITRISLGPVNEDNEEEIDRLKGLIEKGLE